MSSRSLKPKSNREDILKSMRYHYHDTTKALVVETRDPQLDVDKIDTLILKASTYRTAYKIDLSDPIFMDGKQEFEPDFSAIVREQIDILDNFIKTLELKKSELKGTGKVDPDKNIDKVITCLWDELDEPHPSHGLTQSAIKSKLKAIRTYTKMLIDGRAVSTIQEPVARMDRIKEHWEQLLAEKVEADGIQNEDSQKAKRQQPVYKKSEHPKSIFPEDFNEESLDNLLKAAKIIDNSGKDLKKKNTYIMGVCSILWQEKKMLLAKYAIFKEITARIGRANASNPQTKGPLYEEGREFTINFFLPNRQF